MRCLEKSETSLRTGIVEPIVSIIENKQRASQHVTGNEEGQQEEDQKILLAFVGLQPLSLNKVWKQ